LLVDEVIFIKLIWMSYQIRGSFVSFLKRKIIGHMAMQVWD